MLLIARGRPFKISYESLYVKNKLFSRLISYFAAVE